MKEKGSDCTVILFIPHQLFPNPLLIRKDMATTGLHTHLEREKVEKVREETHKNHSLEGKEGKLTLSFLSVSNLSLSFHYKVNTAPL